MGAAAAGGAGAGSAGEGVAARASARASDGAAAAVDPERTVDDLRRLVRTPSVTGDERAVQDVVAAILAELGCEVYTVEIFEALATSAAERLKRLGYGRVTVRHADGHFGWAEAAPFDAILVTAAAG